MQNFFSKGIHYLIDKDYRFAVNGTRFDMYHDMPDEEYLKRIFHYKMGYALHLDNPTTFNEKLQWLKLYDRKPEYTAMVDKYEMKSYISEHIGEQYIIPTIGVWNHFDEIDFDKLPEQFVLKCTHDSGGLSICKDKSIWNKSVAKEKLEKSLKRNYYYAGREWPYKNVQPRILAEKFMSNHGKDLIDFKVHNFNGIPKVILVCAERFSDEQYTQDFFDCEWNHLPVKRPKAPNATMKMQKPACLQEMLEISRILSKNIPFLRTDFYIIEDRLYIGELTFSPASGFIPFEPESFDYELGSYLKLPNSKNLL